MLITRPQPTLSANSEPKQPIMSGDSQAILQFAGFTLDPNSASLWGGAGPLPLRPKAFDVLSYLVRHPGRIVTKDELLASVWPNIFVTDNSLVQCISDIRAALDDEAQEILKTVARRGYLFAAPVIAVDAAPAHAKEQPTDGPGPGVGPKPRATRAPHLRWLIPLAAAAALVIGGGAWWWHGERVADRVASSSNVSAAPEPVGKRVTIAVLPLTSLGGPPSEDYFADGLTEDIIAALGRFTDLSVASPKAVFAYKGNAARSGEIGRELKVRYIAEGSVRRSPERIRIAIRLSDAAQGTLLWADQYDADPANIFAVQDDITRRITGALAVRLTNVEQARVAAKPPSSLEAYDLVLRGRDFLARLTRSAASNARTMFERAIELDANYPPAHVGLGRIDVMAVSLGWTADPAGALRRAESHARKAVAIDEFNPAAHALLGRVLARLGEYDRSVESLRRALTLNPSDPDGYAGLGDALLWTGDIDGAIKALEVAVELDPKLSSEDLFGLGAGYLLAGRRADAIRTLERPVARNDANAFIYAILAAAYAEDGQGEQAARAAAEARRLSPFFDLENFGTLFRNPEHRGQIITALQKAGF